jgi:hypothetical protein
MIDQTSILRIVAASEGQIALEDICRKIAPRANCAPRSPTRQRVLKCLSKLMTAGYIESELVSGLPKIAVYSATKAGRAFAATGEQIVGGNFGSGKYRRPPRQGTVKQRLWTALRHLKKATYGDLVEVIHRKGETAVNLTDCARGYLKALARAGIVVQLANRQAGTLPSSRGFVRYALVNDVGPLAPVCGKRDVFDPNARKSIPFLEKAHA